MWQKQNAARSARLAIRRLLRAHQARPSDRKATVLAAANAVMVQVCALFVGQSKEMHPPVPPTEAFPNSNAPHKSSVPTACGRERWVHHFSCRSHPAETHAVAVDQLSSSVAAGQAVWLDCMFCSMAELSQPWRLLLGASH